VLAIALVDGVGIPLALGDPELAAGPAADGVLAALAAMVGLAPPRG